MDDFSIEDLESRIVSQDEQAVDDWQFSLRPRKLSEYIGQDKAKISLSVAVYNHYKRLLYKDEKQKSKSNRAGFRFVVCTRCSAALKRFLLFSIWASSSHTDSYTLTR